MTQHKRYILAFTGNPETVAFLKRHVSEQQPNLARARELGRAAKVLLGVEYRVTSVTVRKPTAERVRSI